MKRVLICLLILTSAYGVFRYQQLLDSRRVDHPEEEVLYLSDPEMIQRMSFGHSCLMADLYWLRVVQYYGGKDRSQQSINYDLLAPLLKVAVSLDPQMITVYRFGAIFLSEPKPIGAGNVPAALELLDQGIRQNPDAWSFLYDKGFIYYWQTKDYKQAAEWLFRASRHAQAPPGLDGLAQNILVRQGDIETAEQLWRQQYDQASNDKLRRNALKNLENLRLHKNLWTLEWVVNRFYQRENHYPSGWEELIKGGWLKERPRDPSGEEYILNPKDGAIAPEEKAAAKLSPLPAAFKEHWWSQLDQRQR